MKSRQVVLDSWALLALLRGEGEAALFMRRLMHRAKAGNVVLVMNVVNLGEVYYRCIQLTGEAAADEQLALIRAMPITIVPAKETIVLEAARLKARYRLGYTGAMVVATARQEQAPMYTGDPGLFSLPAEVVTVRRLTR